MKRAPGNNSWLSFVVCGLCIFISFFSINKSAQAEAPAADTGTIINFYNPAGSFLYEPVAGVRANEHEMRAGLLYDIGNKKIVWQKEMNTPYPIASLTKMMVALLTVEDVRAGKISW